MKIKLSEIEPKILILQDIMKKKIPVKMSYAVSKSVKELIKEYETLMEQRTKLYSDAAQKDEDGNPVIVDSCYKFETDEDRDKANNSYMELLNTEVEIDLMSIDKEDLERCDTSDKYDALTGFEVMNIVDIVSAEN